MRTQRQLMRGKLSTAEMEVLEERVAELEPEAARLRKQVKAKAPSKPPSPAISPSAGSPLAQLGENSEHRAKLAEQRADLAEKVRNSRGRRQQLGPQIRIARPPTPYGLSSCCILSPHAYCACSRHRTRQRDTRLMGTASSGFRDPAFLRTSYHAALSGLGGVEADQRPGDRTGCGRAEPEAERAGGRG